MPVEIREIVIKTEVNSEVKSQRGFSRHEELTEFKKKLLSECRKMIKETSGRKSYKR